MRRLGQILFIALSALTFLTTQAVEFKFNGHTFTVQGGFEVELVTNTNLLQRPVSASFDELGRLYVTDSSGSNDKPTDQLANPTHRVVRLADTDGDGKFDKSMVFADKMMFPEGCLYYDGSVYVAAPPSIWKLTDTNNDGVADVRVEWHQGKTLTGCANDLHGPYLGPDGWIYWCKGAFAEQTYEVNGKPFKSRAAHIFRARPDHSGLEPVMTGGMDNPVGLTFTATGERILCGTFFAPHEPGHRDGLIHAIYGGVYGKINEVTDSHIKTGDLMPVMTHMGPAAPAAVTRYESRVFGEEYRDNLFCCQFNTHKVSRHVMEPHGATFKTKDSDFLVSDNPDFHPTDVLEDADGSLLILDTGPWYKLCCPTSQLAKPDLLGAIYRVKRKGAPKVEDPRGLKIVWSRSSPETLSKLLGDERPAVVRRAIEMIAKRGNEAVPALKEIVLSGNKPEGLSKQFNLENGGKTDRVEWEQQYQVWLKKQVDRLPNKANKRQNALWALTRIATDEAQVAVRAGIKDYEPSVSLVACQSISLHRDSEGARQIITASPHPLANKRNWDMSGPLGRASFEIFGRTSTWHPEMLWVLTRTSQGPFSRPMDFMNRIEQHSLTYSLIESKAKEVALAIGDMVALDQIDNSSVKPDMIITRLKSAHSGWEFGESGGNNSFNQLQQNCAAWVAGRHPEWGDAFADFFREELAWKEAGKKPGPGLSLLPKFAHSPAVQQVINRALSEPSKLPETYQLLLRSIVEADVKKIPQPWIETINGLMESKDATKARGAIAAARALGQRKKDAPDFSEKLRVLAQDKTQPDDLRLEALAGLPKGLKTIEPELFDFLLSNLESSKPVATRNAAASVLTKAKLTSDQFLKLADALKGYGPLEVSNLLLAFEHTADEQVGLKLIAALKESKGLAGARPDALKALAAKYPTAVQRAAEELIATLNVDAGKQKAHIDELLVTLPKGEIRRGQLIFNSSKAACSSCHKMGYAGGTVGPDLTAIGPVRTERDLLEAIVYPSASFVRSYEPFIVHTKGDEDFSGVLTKDAPDEIVLTTGPNAEVRVARAEVVEMRPGKVSVMPAGLDQMLSKQELADVLAFLKNAKWGAN